jgi:predicted phosphodiesterase
MRIAVISDIHSNIQALRSTLEVIDASNVQEIYCLGDTVGYGANPNECVELLRQRSTHVVRGNHDHAILEEATAKYFSRAGRTASEWTRSALTKENRDFLGSLPLRVDTEVCTIAHACPFRPEEWEYVLSLEIAERQFSAFKTPVCFIGHTHIPVVCGEDLLTFSFGKDMRFLVNVGSVGQPRDGNPESSFGLLDTDTWEYENKRVAYDIAGAAEAIKNAGLPDILAKRLFEGV